MPNTWLYADPHYGHANIINYENRPFWSLEEMDAALIANHNKAVKKMDKVFCLGDFAFYKKEKIIEIVSQLNGYKVLILGNHDRCHSVSWWKNYSGFDEVYPYPIIYDGFWMFSHEPLYINSNMPYANIYGHVHSNPQYCDFNEQTFCVSIERICYAPISFEEVKRKMGG